MWWCEAAGGRDLTPPDRAPGGLPAVVVSQVDPGGKAEAEGRIRVGDLVLCVNEVPCSRADQARQLVDSAFSTLTLLVWRSRRGRSASPAQSREKTTSKGGYAAASSSGRGRPDRHCGRRIASEAEEGSCACFRFHAVAGGGDESKLMDLRSSPTQCERETCPD
ncbi:hypothetical protein MTO96_002106 [Rhipicephalus appendiculatus]